MSVRSVVATLIAGLFVAGAAAAAERAPIVVETHDTWPRGTPQSETYVFDNGLLRVILHFDDFAPPMKVTSVEAICNGRRHSFAIQGDYYSYWTKVYGKAEMFEGHFFQATFLAPLTTQNNGTLPDHHLSITCDRRGARSAIDENTPPPRN